MLWFKNLLERANKETRLRTNAVGVFINDQAEPQLDGAVLAEPDDEQQTLGRRYVTIDNVTAIELNQPNTPELEAAQHQPHGLGPGRNTPLDGTLPTFGTSRAVELRTICTRTLPSTRQLVALIHTQHKI